MLVNRSAVEVTGRMNRIAITAITKTTPANHVPEILQPQHSINTSTNPEGCHMSNFIMSFPAQEF